jgi:EpsI family protein
MKKSFVISLVLGVLMGVASVLTLVMTPVAMSKDQRELNLEAIIPGEFTDWKVDRLVTSPLVSSDVTTSISNIYNQTLSRTYINSKGDRVMLEIAYGRDQSTDMQVHRPEICYTTGGFEVGKITKTFEDTPIGIIPVMRLVARQGSRNEPITYWIRVGDSLTRGWLEQKLASFRYGMKGQVPDGLLFRISTISNDEDSSYQIQQSFLTALLPAVRSEDRYWLVGKLGS